MTSSIKELATTELAKRIASMSVDELLRIASAGPAPEKAPASRPPIGLRDAFMRVMRESDRPLTSNEIVDRVLQLRPGTPDPSIRSEITRGRQQRVVRLIGEVRGGTYELRSRSTVRPKAASG